jgi:hypothetical protein
MFPLQYYLVLKMLAIHLVAKLHFPLHDFFPLLITTLIRFSPVVKRGRVVTLITHPYLVAEVKYELGAIPPLPPCASMACSGTTLPYFRLLYRYRLGPALILNALENINRQFANIKLI